METKRGTVTAVAFKKSGQGQYGPYHIFTITFDNGDSGDYMSKTNPQTAFVMGQSAEYTKETKVNGNYTNVSIKIPSSGGNNFKGANPAQINKRTALECAVRLAVGIGPAACNPEMIFKTADKFNAWLNAGAPVQQQTPPPTHEQAPPPTDNDLPEWLR